MTGGVQRCEGTKVEDLASTLFYPYQNRLPPLLIGCLAPRELNALLRCAGLWLRSASLSSSLEVSASFVFLVGLAGGESEDISCVAEADFRPLGFGDDSLERLSLLDPDASEGLVRPLL